MKTIRHNCSCFLDSEGDQYVRSILVDGNKDESRQIDIKFPDSPHADDFLVTVAIAPVLAMVD